MPIQKDPDGIEQSYLHKFAPLHLANVLEIGCGEGRLTWQYAASTARTTGIDLNLSRLTEAQKNCPSALKTMTDFTQATSELLPFADETFDVAILAWSL